MEPSNKLRIELSEAGGNRLIRLEGELSAATGGRLRTALLDALRPERKTILDTAGLTAVDLSGLQLICSAHRTYLSRNAVIEIRGMPESIHEALRAAGFDPQQSVCPYRQKGAVSDSTEETRMIDRYREAYIEEASERLGELERALLELEENPMDAEAVGRVFRALHTIKGSGAMCGFDAIASFTHEIETAFDEVRMGRNCVSPELIGVTLDARDHIQEMLNAPEGVEEELRATSAGILSRLPHSSHDKPVSRTPGEAAAAGEPRTYRIRFDPHRNLFLRGTDPILLLRDLAALGDCSLIAHLEHIPQLDDFNPEECYAHWDAVLTTPADENTIRKVFVFVENCSVLDVQCAGEPNDSGRRRRLGEILVARGDVARDEAEKCLESRPLAGEMLVKAGLVTPDRVGAAVLEQRHLDAVRDKQDKAAAATTLRVPAAKLDTLVDVVGELVTVAARLSSYATASGAPEANLIAGELERLTGLLRESTMSIRMLPIGETFARFKRLVRDLSAELGKKVELITEGNDTELDKTVIEQLSDPLVHLIRNAVDHGIERPGRRAALGKPATGTIRLTACHSGAFVLIEVGDDGAGMDRDAIRTRAVELGMISADAALSDPEIFGLTLKPGFSTSSRITSVSGRGVGMDVVQRNIEALRGVVFMESTPGCGTTVTLKIPLTLAIIDGLLIEAAGAFFVAPLANISECVEIERPIEWPSRHSPFRIRGELVPCIALREWFALPGEPPPIEQVIVAETRSGRYGFVVDRVIGDHNTVIKKLGGLYRNIQEISGATILGDGTIALILDIDKIAAEALRESLRG
jgi:two-component system, chemotaxis family, sensor kinase CheA